MEETPPEEAGLRRITFHDLRHTVATALKDENIHPRDVADLLGHSSTKMTMEYTHVLPDAQATLVQKIERLLWSETEDNDGQNVGQGG